MRPCRLVAAILVICLPACATWRAPRSPPSAVVAAPGADAPSSPPANAAPSTETVKPVPSTAPPPAKPTAAPRAGATANAPPVSPRKTPPSPVKPQASAPPTPAPAEKPSAPTLDLAGLEQRLKDTHAIGVFTKLTLKNQVDDLLGQFRSFHQSTVKTPPDPLRRQYDALILKVLSLLQDSDPQLASDISSSRDALWGILIDPQKFAKI